MISPTYGHIVHPKTGQYIGCVIGAEVFDRNGKKVYRFDGSALIDDAGKVVGGLKRLEGPAGDYDSGPADRLFAANWPSA